jgi:ABC-2 type transport system permease protein
MNLTPFIALVRKDLILYLSNRRALLLNLLMPIALGAFFGYIFGGSGSSSADHAKVKIAIVQQDTSAIGQKLQASFSNDPAFAAVILPMDEARTQVTKGKQSAALVIPAGFGDAASKALFNGKDKPKLGILYDPSEAATLGMVRGIAMQHVMRVVSADAFASRQGTGAPGGAGIEIPFSTEMQPLSANPAQYNGYAHSFGGMCVQFILFMAIDAGIGILLAQRLGLWSRMLAAPVSSNTLLMARLISSALISFGIMLVVFAVAAIVFKVQVNGSAVGLAGVAACFALMAASFGLLVAALGKTPEAARGIASFATLIMVMLGGAWMPSFYFPQWLQSLTLFVPTRWVIDGFDAMTWRGMGIESALPAMGVQLGFALLFGSIALWRMRRT